MNSIDDVDVETSTPNYRGNLYFHFRLYCFDCGKRILSIKDHYQLDDTVYCSECFRHIINCPDND